MADPVSRICMVWMVLSGLVILASVAWINYVECDYKRSKDTTWRP